MKKIISYMAISAMLSGIIPATAMAQTTADVDPSQYGKPYKNVPDRRDVSMYQVNMRSFSKEGNFKGVIARLDSIKALGVNVVYILPIYPVGVLKAQGSPYAVKDYRQINTEFGTLDDLRALVNGVHKRKMAIIIDWVGNHTSWDNPWIVNKDWYEQDSTGNIKHAQTWRDVAQLNFKNNDMRLTMIKDMKYWVLTANVDGFRCDYADGPPADFWKQAIDTLRNIPVHKLLFLAEGTRGENFNAGFDYNFGFRFFENLKRIYKKGKSVKSIDTINSRDYANAADGQQMVRYITNHDVNSSDGSPIPLFGGKKGSMAAFVVVAYMKSVPMIYDGQEVGTPYRLVFPFTKSKIDWTLNPDVTAEYKKVIAFRNSSEAVRRGELISYSSDDVCAFTKTLGAKSVFVLSNLRNTTVSYTIPSNLLTYKWKDGFTGSRSELNGVITLAPYQYIVLKN
ncbi:alpha-amylase family glycosyl hydrolase [Mucilaginibacter sp. E4BP6]|uniref:alpha-amylase family glycosyl hydrolase n=1 Tax=Mucilaginibacter sp. E4BP6 TaxID=2723089 RepID=UPI0015CBF303|nr:alpha-amylase family glycosyl hydrolase [Mucilaginibacter sp. E4BP6]NYE67161.1 glycosidase [Mucilaginibacter sp. E4BP6]